MSACTKVKIKLNLTLKTDNIFFPILFLSQIDLTWMIFFSVDAYKSARNAVFLSKDPYYYCLKILFIMTLPVSKAKHSFHDQAIS